MNPYQPPPSEEQEPTPASYMSVSWWAYVLITVAMIALTMLAITAVFSAVLVGEFDRAAFLLLVALIFAVPTWALLRY